MQHIGIPMIQILHSLLFASLHFLQIADKILLLQLQQIRLFLLIILFQFRHLPMLQSSQLLLHKVCR